MITLKILAGLLSYPDEALLAALPEMAPAIVDDALLPPRQRAAINGFLSELGSDDLLDLQERYVNLFDRTRSLSLHLFEHVHGESRERGAAMIDLRALYLSHGLALSAHELPDYLPVFLEFLAQRPLAEAQTLLADIAHILREIGDRLVSRGSPYCAVFGALLTLAGERELDAAPAAKPEAEEPDLALLDREWEDAPITFGPGCQSSAPQEAVIRVHRRQAA
jgi:nitrate reductase molybdenum cofactor assembly chaperone NarJ/NarW